MAGETTIPGKTVLISEWVAALTAADCELMVHGALRAGDVKAVFAAMRLLVTKDPHRAEVLLDVIKVALEVAKSGPEGRAGMAAELQTMFRPAKEVRDHG